MKNIALTTLLTLWVVVPAEARLLETEAECISRYGSPMKEHPAPSSFKRLQFQKQGFGFILTFWKGRCHTLALTKIGSSQLTQEEVLLFLSKAPTAWKEVRSKDINERAWTSTEFAAEHNRVKDILFMYTHDGLKELDAQRKNDTVRNLEDF